MFWRLLPRGGPILDLKNTIKGMNLVHILMPSSARCTRMKVQSSVAWR